MSAHGFQRKVDSISRRERFSDVAQVSKPAVSPISKSAARVMPRGSRVWKPATRQTGKSALQRSTPGAAPAPIFRTGAKAGCDGIVSEVTGNPRLLVFIPNPVIVRFRLPERFFAHTQKFLGPARGELFPRFQNIAQHLIRHRPHDGMTVIWHHNPIVQQIPAPVKVSQRVRDEIGNVGPTQVTGAHASVKIAFYHAAKVT